MIPEQDRNAPSSSARAEQTVHVGFVELDDLRDQENLARDAASFQRRLEFLVDDALMGGVLIDDDEPVARLRNDIGLVHLRAGGAERMPIASAAAKNSRRRADFEARLRRQRRSAHIERRLSRLGKADAGARRARARGSPGRAGERRQS